MKANMKPQGGRSIEGLQLGGGAGCQENISGVPEARSVSHLTSPYIALLAQNNVARITESVTARYGALPATTPMLATVSPFFIEGTAHTYRTTPLDSALASHTVLPNRSVT